MYDNLSFIKLTNNLYKQFDYFFVIILILESNKKEVIPSASETTKYSVLSDLTDVTIGINENRLYYYSDVLRLASPVFATKLENLDENGKISLDEENVQDISMVLELLDPSNEEDVITNGSSSNII